MNKLIKILPLLATGVALVGCQDEDFGFNAKDIRYETEFRKAFGKIDPEQDWNLSTRATANVNLGEDATVKIYSESPLVTSAKLMANYEVKDSRTFEFDLPQGTKDVYVQAVSKRGAIVSGYYNVEDGMVNVNARQAGAATRATDPCHTTIAAGDPTTLHVYYGTGNTKEISMYNLENVHAERATPWKVGDFRKVLDTYTNANGTSQNGVFKEGENNWLKWVKTGTLTGDVEFTMKSTGPVSVTFNYCKTSTANNCLAYFYYTGDRPSIEEVTLYNLIPNATDGGEESATGENRIEFKNGTWQNWGPNTFDLFTLADATEVKGTTYDLVYFDGATPSFDFPEGTKIGFAVVQANNKTGEGPIHGSDKCWFSVESMNPTAGSWGFGTTYDTYMPTAASFKMGDVTFLGFEDWPDDTHDGGGSDLNDLLFFAVGDFEEDIPDVDPDPVKYTQDWMLIYEDLGNSFDWDYNDVVLKVEHVSGETTAKITALAAGGTLSSHVFYNEEDLGEIHTWFDQKPAASGSNTVTNAESRGNKGATKTIDVDENFSMTTLGQVADMGGIILKVKKAGETDFSEESTTIAYDLDDKGTAPEVICLPASWTYTDESGNYIRREFRWPAEIHNIDKAYPHFKDWAANKSLYPGWYAEDPILEHCVTGTFEQQVSAPTDRIDLTKLPSNLTLIGNVIDVPISGAETSATYTVAISGTNYTTEGNGEISYESSNTSVVTVAVNGDNLIITRQTNDASTAYIKIVQSGTDEYIGANIEYIKVTLEQRAKPSLSDGNPHTLTAMILTDSTPWSGASWHKIDFSQYTCTENSTATILVPDSNIDGNSIVYDKNWNGTNQRTQGTTNDGMRTYTLSKEFVTEMMKDGLYIAYGNSVTSAASITITFHDPE